MTPTLTADDLAGRHAYLAHARPDFERSMAGIRLEGGPWPCGACGNASLLCYRCSACGRDLAEDGSTRGRES